MIVSMSNVWDRATEFLSDNLATVVPVALFAVFLPISISGSIQPIAKAAPDSAAWVNLAVIALMLAVLWGQIALSALALDPPGGRTIATAAANGRILPMIGIMLLLLLAVFVLMLPIPILLAVGGFDVTAAMAGGKAELPPGIGGAIGLYGLVLFLVMMFVVARLVLLVPAVVAEKRGLGAIRRAFALTKGIFWKTFGIIILYYVVFGVSYLAAQTVFGSILRLLLGGDGAVSLASVLTSVLTALVQTVFIVLASAFAAKLYLALRAVRDGAEPVAGPR